MTRILVALLLLTCTIQAAPIDELPNNCVLLAIKAREVMGRGEILSVYGTIKGKKMGHAVLVLREKGMTCIYDTKGTRPVPGAPSFAELAPVVALDAFKEIPSDLGFLNLP